MSVQSHDPGLQLVLDNRWLVVAFGLLVLMCGGFFVFGYYLGKHQGSDVAEKIPISAPQPTASAEKTDKSSPASPAVKAEDRQVREDLDWYKNVGSKAPADNKRLEPAPSDNASSGGTAATTAGISTYSVQVGAFRQRKEAEAKADLLKTKNFASLIEAPKVTGGLFLLKVGKFESKADAVAMKLRLNKAGFACFVKPNQ